MRDPAVRAGFLRLSVDQRRRLAGEARAGSREHLATASKYITDVNPAAVEALFRSAGAGTMIHGHTHRPAAHESVVDGRPARRFVLGDWHAAASVLLWDSGGPRLLPCPV